MKSLVIAGWAFSMKYRGMRGEHNISARTVRCVKPATVRRCHDGMTFFGLAVAKSAVLWLMGASISIIILDGYDRCGDRSFQTRHPAGGAVPSRTHRSMAMSSARKAQEYSFGLGFPWPGPWEAR